MKGYFEHVLSRVEDLLFSVVHIDCDLYQSYMTCLEFFYPRVVAGGFIVFDEDEFSATVYPCAQRAIDSFLADKAEPIECFPGAPTHAISHAVSYVSDRMRVRASALRVAIAIGVVIGARCRSPAHPIA